MGEPRGPAINHHALQAFRKQLGLTQVELGGLVGTHPAHISRIEAGERRRPSLALTSALATALNVPIQALLAAGDSLTAGTAR